MEGGLLWEGGRSGSGRMTDSTRTARQTRSTSYVVRSHPARGDEREMMMCEKPVTSSASRTGRTRTRFMSGYLQPEANCQSPDPKAGQDQQIASSALAGRTERSTR